MNSYLIKKLRIAKVFEETAETRTFTLQPLDGWAPVYKPGQFITLVFYTTHGEKRRSYSITSSPEYDSGLTITVKKIENGEFSRALVYHAREGDTLFCSGIGGLFTVEHIAPGQQFCFIAAGSGITPCFSIIKMLLSESDCRIVLIYSNKDEDSTIFYTQLKHLQSLHSNRLVIHFLFSNHSDLYHRRLGKWLLEQLLDRYIGGEIKHTSFYLCGPFDYMQMAEIVILNRTDKQHVHKENYSSLPRLELPQPPDSGPHTAVIHINGNTHTLEVKYPLSITKTARKAHIELPYSCEAGRCGSCIATCTKGKIWMAYNEVLTDLEVKNGRILTCQSFPIDGDVVIEFDRD